MVLMRGHNICLHLEIRNNSFELSSIPILSGVLISSVTGLLHDRIMTPNIQEYCLYAFTRRVLTCDTLHIEFSEANEEPRSNTSGGVCARICTNSGYYMDRTVSNSIPASRCKIIKSPIDIKLPKQ